MMQRETRVTYGPVPHDLSGEPMPEMSWQIRGDDFLLRGEGEHYFHYRKGQGITIDRGRVFDPSEESLWLNGSVYSAVASMNGLVPIHASAVAVAGQAFAFTATAGGGKSTLVAALAARGLAMFCDDTLVLDLADPEQIICLPGHKRLKLRPDALDLTGAIPEEKVSQTVEKYYATPSSATIGVALPLRELIFLEEGAGPFIVPIRGAQRFARLQDDHQTARLLSAARQFDCSEYFELFRQMATQIEMSAFIRPKDTSCFAAGVDIVADHIRRQAEAEL